MKVLFLDVDGVLNRQGTPATVEWMGKMWTGLQPELVKMFLDWREDKKDLHLCLSSSWRNAYPFVDVLIKSGVDFKGITCRGHSRGQEIEEYLESLKDVEAIAVLDDNPVDIMNKYLVQTSAKTGLRERNLRQLDRLLGYETPSE